MSKVTAKYQVSIPKALAETLGIRVGDEIEWEDAGGVLRARLPKTSRSRYTVQDRLRFFDAASARQAERVSRLPKGKNRGWTRDDLYTR
jgi:AbrB family looped-hinge helix DNA binding protein